MNQLELIQNRRSCRHFEPQSVESEKIELLKKAALWSPTSKNNRPWEFIVVDDTALLESLSLCKPHGAAFVKNAPLAIVIAGDPSKSDVWVEDCSIAAILLQMTAEDLGLGSCWIQTRLREHNNEQSASDYIGKLLKLPEGLQTLCIIAIGYKQRTSKPYSNDQLLQERFHHNQFRDINLT
jgi:nitroreductase